MKEIWKPIVGYEKYYMCSNLGRIKTIKRKFFVKDPYWKREYWKTVNEKIIKQSYDNNGYRTVAILGKRMRSHRLIAKTFIPNPLNKPQVNHKDLNKSNNHISNLEWVTNGENVRHAIRNGAHKNIKGMNAYGVYMCDLKTHKLIKKFVSITEAYEYFGRKYQGGISQVCNGKRNKTMGYWWTYEKKQTK